MQPGIFGFPVDYYRTKIIEFKSNGSFVVPEGVSLIYVSGIGGGGAGGADTLIDGGTFSGGGGSGAWCWLYPLIVRPQEYFNIIIGAGGIANGGPGGTTIIGNYIQLGGGLGGASNSNTPGAGGTYSLPRMNGFSIGPISNGSSGSVSSGSSSVFGPGGVGGSDADGSPPPRFSYGAGGGGSQISMAPGRNGGNGAPGIVIINW